jgi:hypothetical protein
MIMFRHIAISTTMAISLGALSFGQHYTQPTFRPTRQELLRPPTRSWSIPRVCHVLPVAPGGLQTM